MFRKLLVVWALAASLGLAACGDDDGSKSATEEAERATTPSQAVAEIAEVKAGLAAALSDYRQGRAAAAEEAVADAYLEHFEHVEAPLAKVDEELNEELEHLIATEIRDEIKAGAPVSDVAKLVRKAERDLDRAVRALRAG